jgi:hypothetical protein
MHGRFRAEVPAELAKLARRFAAWRRSREAGTRIPQQLWDAAVDVASRHGLSRTATVLALGFYDLRRRLALSSRGKRDTQASSLQPAFVELPPIAAGRECIIEFENRDGSRMRMHVKGMSVPDLVALGQSFWGSP